MTASYSTITIKGQITLPANLRRKYNLAPGLKVTMREVDGGIMIDPPRDMAAVRARARAEMQAAGTLNTVIGAGEGWRNAASTKIGGGSGQS